MQNSSKMAAAKKLAKLHFRVEPDLRKIFLLEPFEEENPEEPIKLLEVVRGALERGVEPVYFPANPDRAIPFPSVVVELSPKEFKEFGRKPMQVRNKIWTLGPELAR